MHFGNYLMKLSAEPILTAEDDRLRSLHMQGLIQGEQSPDAFSNSTNFLGECPVEPKIPKVVIQFWDDLRAIPDDVQECLGSWELMDSFGFKRVLFGDAEARAFIEQHLDRRHLSAFDRCGHPAMRSDYFRLCYINQCGGFYVDADEVCHGVDCSRLFQNDCLKLHPLCYEISSDTMISTEVFIHQRKSSTDWIFYVNNNPIIAPAKHPVLQYALERSTYRLLNIESARHEVQSTTGPGNLTASLVRHSILTEQGNRFRDFELLGNWDSISTCRWALGYRQDQRNWRLWKT